MLINMRTFILKNFWCRVLCAALMVMAGGTQVFAWDEEADANGKYDGVYDRPTHFPTWSQPSDWPNAEYYLVCARFGEDGPRVENYEVAVYDQRGELRHCNRSMAKDNHLCVLTIRGTEGDEFHCQIIYGDFEDPTIVDVPETFGFKTNDIVGSVEAPFYLTVPGRTIISETATELPVDKAGADVRVIRTIKANEWGTICLPFAMNEEQVQAAFGTDVLLGDFTGCKVSYEDDEETVEGIEVKFEAATAIEANHPYIIKVSTDISEFEVDGVDVHAEEASVDCDEQKVKVGGKIYRFYNSFVCNYVAGFTIPEQCLFLGGGLFWYSVGLSTMKGLRCYFNFYDVLPEASEAGVRMTIAYDDGTTTEINDLPLTSPCEGGKMGAGVWYDMQGRRITPCPPNGAEMHKGIYICNGRKYIIK